MINWLDPSNLQRVLFKGEEVIGKRLRFVNSEIYAGTVEFYLYEESFHPSPDRTDVLHTVLNPRFGRGEDQPERRVVVPSAVVIRGERVGIGLWANYELRDYGLMNPIESSDA